jgi:AcrR family transcriptional regulator
MAAVKRSDKRAYDNSDRRARSAETRGRVLEVARSLITTKGYRAATVAEIAHTAGVHVDTVYELVGRKPALLRALIEAAISGGPDPVPPEQREYVIAMRAEPDPARKLVLYAHAVTTIHTRIAPLQVALRDAATTEPEAMRVWQEINDRRARNMRDLVAELGPVGTLRDGMGVDEAAETIWAMASAEMFILLTSDRGWSLAQYERWLADAWQRLLLAR